MKKVIHLANTRGEANHGWLHAKHSFSFASWYNPERVQFGALRVLNDDKVAAEMGFGTHPHDNMEIITIPLEGDLAHKDSMGNQATIKSGDVQVMSAGTGIQHSEFNPNKDMHTKLFQIWVFPHTKNVTPRYQQITLNEADRVDNLQQILSPDQNDDGVWIHQDAWFHLGKFTAEKDFTYNLKKEGNGVYIMVVKGNAIIETEALTNRDAIGVWETNSVAIKAEKDTEILVLEVPMNY